MTTIGTAVLQIIPSLRGVTEAIESQIDGKAIEIQVKPKVDQRATEAAAKETRETVEKQTTEVKVQPKVDKRAAEQAGKDLGDEITKTVEKSSPGKDLAKVLVDGIADGVKDELRGGPLVDEFVDGLADGVKQGIDQGGVSKTILSTISDGLKSGNVGGTIKDAILPTITGIGPAIRGSVGEWSSGIANALRSGEIFGATADVKKAILATTTDAIGEITGLKGALNSVDVGPVQNGLKNISDVLSGFDKNGDSGLERALGKVGGHAGNLAGMVGNAQALINLLNDPKTEEALNKIPGMGVAKDVIANKPAEAGAGVRQWVIDNLGITPPDVSKWEGFRKKEERVYSGGEGTFGDGGYTGNFPVDKIAGVVHGGEFVIRKSATDALQSKAPGLLDALNGYKDGGLVGPDVSVAKALAGIPYSQGNRTDCSGMVSRVILQSLGKSGGLMTTKTADKWLSALGFRSGTGGPGAITVGWYDRGPNPNDGHMAMTLSDGTHAEAGGRNRVFTLGAGARGGEDSSFDRHMFLNLLVGKGSASGDGQITGEGPATGGIPAASTTDAVTAAVNSGGSGSGGVSLASSISGLAGMGGDAISAGHTSSEGHRDPLAPKYFPKAVSAAVSGQVSSALGVFGVNDSPGWLKGISDFVGGISVSDKNGKKVFDGGNIGGTFGDAGSLFGGAAPAAPPAPAPAALPSGAMHGAQAGQKPGPTVNYNIRTALTEDAFIEARKQEQIRIASKVDRY
ncbi:hypothetical protein H5U98_28585 [Mycolicibacterium boenickei]|uniref:NlpC/P60 domain-containing protein n=1 Tax=Mycolicibacterium boenickei TaxID=146017 RepID=A0AAX2ZVC5_9MYCO|nr:hypothetical protein [Mycolicibacterium boenickei]PEG59763.1 hypothetical protein CQY21_16085 [Mycolicibacterium boenickei]UNB99375.1 hypothetical protein H5U98_28585 [Mycolicibacterium boenickei]BBX89011.1 hypothetical protein MBOE_06600 [Mycolicibacterium boenickei]